MTYGFDNVGSFEETIFSAVPEGQVALAMCDEKIVVQWVKSRASQVLLKSLNIS